MTEFTFTENQAEWLRNLLSDAADEEFVAAQNCHLFALGSDADESAAQWEEYADEHREYAGVLRRLVTELGIDKSEE